MGTGQGLIDPGAMLATTHALADGSRVRLRLTRPTDLEKIEAFLEKWSLDGNAADFAFYDPRERLTLAATLPSGVGEEVVGLADVAVVPTEPAETGVVVGHGWRGRGLGTLLSAAAASLARRRRRAA
jgi:GNAT superfamily N-acetyltransferase